MESAEQGIVSRENEPIKTDVLREHQRRIFEALRQLNVGRYCPSATEVSNKAHFDPNQTASILKDLCGLGIVIWRIDESTGDESYRLCKPEEFVKKEIKAAKKGGSVSPKVTSRVESNVLSCPKCNFVTKSYAGLHIHIGQKHKTAASVKQNLKAKKKEHAPDPPTSSEPLVTITLTMNEALETGVALALADKINQKRFENSHNISDKVLQALAELIIDEAHPEAS